MPVLTRAQRKKKLEELAARVPSKYIVPQKDWTFAEFFSTFYITGFVGGGTFSKVYRGLVRTKEPTVPIAFKCFRPYRQTVDDIEAECKKIKRLKHPNVVKFIGLIRINMMHIMMTEYSPYGDLHRYLVHCDVSWFRNEQFVREIANAIHYLHTRARIVHMDIKPENIVFGREQQAQICDFGASVKFKSTRTTISALHKGTDMYRPPESLQTNYCDSTTDIWAFGCVVYEIFTREHPFFPYYDESYTGKSPRQMMENALKKMHKNKRTAEFYRLATPHRELISELLQPMREKRPSIKKVLRLEWFKDGCN